VQCVYECVGLFKYVRARKKEREGERVCVSNNDRERECV